MTQLEALNTLLDGVQIAYSRGAYEMEEVKVLDTAKQTFLEAQKPEEERQETGMNQMDAVNKLIQGVVTAYKRVAYQMEEVGRLVDAISAFTTPQQQPAAPEPAVEQPTTQEVGQVEQPVTEAAPEPSHSPQGTPFQSTAKVS